MDKTVAVSIERSVAERFPDIFVSAIRARDLELQNLPTHLLDMTSGALIESGITTDDLRDNPMISDWREAMKCQGLKPSSFLSSAEALSRRILKGQTVRTPYDVVDLYNAISIKFLVPLGAYDVERLPRPSLTLRHAVSGHDNFNPIGSSSSKFPLNENVVVYASGNEVTCWAFNHRDSASTCVTDTTRDFIFIGEAAFASQRTALNEAIGALAAELAKCGATVSDNVTIAGHGSVQV